MSLRGVVKQILLTLDISKLNSFLFTMQKCGIDPLIYRLKAKKRIEAVSLKIDRDCRFHRFQEDTTVFFHALVNFEIWGFFASIT